MFDYSNETWFDSNATAQVNFNAFLEAQKAADYVLGGFSGTAQGDMEIYTDLKVKAAQEAKAAAERAAAKEADLSSIRGLYDTAINARRASWDDGDVLAPIAEVIFVS